MPEFVATLLAAAVFCLALAMLNALTRLIIQSHLGPHDLGESGFLQIGTAFVAARYAYRRAPHRGGR